MDIVIITGPFFSVPPATCGAVERVWHDLAHQFAKKGHRVLLLASGGEGVPAEERHGSLRIRRGIRMRSTKNIQFNLAKDAVYALSLLQRIPAADVIVTNAFWIPVLLPVLRRQARTVVSIARVPKGQMKLYVKAGVHRLAPVSSAIQRMVIEECAEAEGRTHWLPNPIDTKAFVPAPGRRSSESRTIVYTGRVHPEKGLDILLQAFALTAKKRQDVRLRIVGPWRIEEGGGGRDFVDGLKSMAEGTPVEFVDPVYNRNELAEILQAADVFCYPSTAEKGEASPVAPLEAMATGLVPVCSDLPQYRDYLEPEVNGVIFDHRGEGAVQRLAAQFERLLKDEKLRLRLGEVAAKTAENYSPSKVADLYLQDFEKLIRQ